MSKSHSVASAAPGTLLPASLGTCIPIMGKVFTSVGNIYFHNVSLQIRLMVLNPEHGFISDRPLTEDDVQLLVDVCVRKLSQVHSPSLATIQMQVYFDTNFGSRHDIINENRTNIQLHTSNLIKEIIETYANTKDDLEKLYRKIVVVTVTSSGLGNPTHPSVLKEATGMFNIQSLIVTIMSRAVVAFHMQLYSFLGSLSLKIE